MNTKLFHISLILTIILSVAHVPSSSVRRHFFSLSRKRALNLLNYLNVWKTISQSKRFNVAPVIFEINIQNRSIQHIELHIIKLMTFSDKDNAPTTRKHKQNVIFISKFDVVYFVCVGCPHNTIIGIAYRIVYINIQHPSL